MKGSRAMAKQTQSIIVMNLYSSPGGSMYYSHPVSIPRYTYIKLPRMELVPHGTKLILF